MGFNEIYGVLLGFIGFYWVLLNFNGFQWVLLGFIWVLLGFAGFYWILLSFTGFYWVLLGFFILRRRLMIEAMNFDGKKNFDWPSIRRMKQKEYINFKIGNRLALIIRRF